MRSVALLMVCVAGCSGESKQAEASASPASTPPRALAAPVGALDACVLLLRADVDRAFAPRVFKTGEHGQRDIAGTERLAAVSSCAFSSTGASVREMMTVNLLVRRAPSDERSVPIATAKAGAITLKATPVDVPALGDAAYWVNLGSSTRPIVELNVFKWKRFWIILSASASQVGTAAALAGLSKLAEAALARL